MLDITPNPIAIQIGSIPVYWYGIGYALGLAAAYFVIVSLARRAGEDPELVGNGMIIVAVAALIGGRLYHVIDQWALYKDDPIKIVLPPYSGLGVYGGIVFGAAAAFLYVRSRRQDFLRWADIVAPGLFTMEAIARWGNFFNQELYGPPTTLPWGIPIDCAHRVAAYACPPGSLPTDTLGQFFHPLFLYESISGVLGALTLVWIGFHLRKRLRTGDLILAFFVWYGTVRFGLETLRADNWTFFGVPVAMIVSALIVIPSLVILAWRHRPGHPLDEPASRPRLATWGALGRPLTDEEIETLDRQAELDDDDEDDDDEDDYDEGDDDDEVEEDGEDDGEDDDGGGDEAGGDEVEDDSAAEASDAVGQPGREPAPEADVSPDHPPGSATDEAPG